MEGDLHRRTAAVLASFIVILGTIVSELSGLTAVAVSAADDNQLVMMSVLGEGYTLSNPAVEMRDGVIYCYDYSDTDGFNSGGIRHANVLILPEPVSGSFTITAEMRPTCFYRQKTGAMVAIGAFAGKDDGATLELDHKKFYTVAQRGDKSAGCYFYNGKSKLGIDPNIKVTDSNAFLTYQLSWDGERFSYELRGEDSVLASGSHEAGEGGAKLYNKSLADIPFYLGVTFDGCDAEIRSLVIESEGAVLYDLSADPGNNAGWERTAWTEVKAPELTDGVFADGKVTANWSTDISLDGGDKLEVTLYHNDGAVKSLSSFESEGTAEFTGLTEEKGYSLQAALIRRGEDTPILSERLTLDQADITELKPPVVRAEVTAKGEITLQWEKVAGAESYDVAYKASSDEAYTIIPDAVSDEKSSLSYVVNDLATGVSYDFIVIAKCEGLEASESKAVTLIAKAPSALWQQSIFGSSTSAGSSGNKYNLITVHEDESVTIASVGGAGKLQDAHDGIAYYYTEVPSDKNFALSADVTVDAFGVGDKQNSFGIMARDVPGRHPNISAGNTSYGYSNMVSLSPYNTDRPMLALMRTGVASAITDEAQLKDIKITKKNFDAETHPYPSVGNTYHMTMKKTNTGYHLILGEGTAEEEIIYYSPKVLETIDPDYVYVGFFTSRNATVTFSNISFSTTNCADDPVGEPEPSTAIKPKVELVSALTSAQAEYELVVRNNVSGALTILQNGAAVVDAKATAASDIHLPVTLAEGVNEFELRLVPDGTQVLESSEEIVLRFTVELKSYAGSIIYASPTGTKTNSGSKVSPVDIVSATSFAKPGQTILLIGGVYQMSEGLVVNSSSSGTVETPVIMRAVSAQDRPVLDFGSSAAGIQLLASHWNISGLDICNSAMNGMLIAGSGNMVENCCFHNNADTGLQITGNSGDPFERWPADNLIKNCDSYDNCDAYGGNADGFAAKLCVGEGNQFIGCTAHHNSDDGWDLYSRSNFGAIGRVIIRDCISYANGTLTDGTVTGGDGNGFKLGGEGIAVNHLIENAISFKNQTAGFTANSNPQFTIKNCTAFGNKTSNFVFSTSNPAYTARGLLSILGGEADSGIISVMDTTNYFWDGTVTKNQNDEAFSESGLRSLASPDVIARDAEGNLLWNHFLMPYRWSFPAGARFGSGTVGPANDGNDSGGEAGFSQSQVSINSDRKRIAVKSPGRTMAQTVILAAMEMEKNPGTGAF